MIGRISSALDWFLTGLAEAALWARDQITRKAVYRIDICQDTAAVRSSEGTEIGQISDNEVGERFHPPSIGARLAGATIELVVPSNWIFRRKLDPIAVESIPYIDAFVRHQIERITPWRDVDVHYGITQSPIEADPSRIAIEIGVLPKRPVKTWLAAIEPLHPKLLRIASRGSKHPDNSCIVLGREGSPRLVFSRRFVVLALLGFSLAYTSGLAWVWWQTSQVRNAIEAEDQIAEQRKALLSRTQRELRSGDDLDGKLFALRRAQARAADVIEALAHAMPDSAHLTDFDLHDDSLTVSGIATDIAVIVPALETSGRFDKVTFGAATTKVEGGAGDRFHLAMTVRGRLAPTP